MEREERWNRWFDTALTNELTGIEELAADINIHKPGNPYWGSLYRIAGLANAGFIDPDEALNQIKYACRHMPLSARDIDYQWQRALKRAKPRYPK